MRVTKMVFHISKPSDDEMKSACERALPMLEPVFWKSLECLKRRVGGYSVFIYSFSQQNHHKWGVYIRKAFGVELDADEYTAQLGEHRALKRTGAPVVFTVPFPPSPPSLAPLTLPWQAESTVLMIPGKKRKAEEPKEDLTLSKTGRPEMTRVCTPAGPVAMAMVQTTLTRSPKKQQPAPEPANPPPVQPRAGQTLFTTHPNPPLVQPGQTLFTTHPKPPGPFLAAGSPASSRRSNPSARRSRPKRSRPTSPRGPSTSAPARR